MSFSTTELQFMMQSYPFMTCILRVNNRTSGWQKTVAKVFKNVYGITNCRMNGDGMIEVSGNIDPKVLLKRLAKAGKKAELYRFQFGECSSNLFINQSDYYGQLGYYYGGQLDGRYLHYGDINPQLKQSSKKKFQYLDNDTKYECTVAAQARERRRRATVASAADEGVSGCCLM
ncbi:heavy metal-associated isoprenylated plant protein 32-like [Lycium ferocissimum]|uniref:heavy metal-associated isoprenylated plant protein 32-like n=1 Tax=Lycium ferocissimum TaxID=112874 RepID=UPI00281542E4|nr:heavy metal-associated isoprenylated plant protein 32-like [Lycium ferocissimum]